MAATIKDVAKLAGVGLATVSSYINGGSVREHNRIKIENAIKELNYEANEIARGLKTNKSKTIGIIIPELDSNFYAAICMKIEDILRPLGYAIIITDSRSNKEREDEAIDFLQKKRVDGLIIVPSTKNSEKIKAFSASGCPVVLLDRLLPGIEGCASVIIDNIQAASVATNRLIDAGHKNIGIIIGPEEIFTSTERKKGYRKALEDNNITYREELVVHGNYTISGGMSATTKLIEQNSDLTAIVLTNYDMTIGAIITLNERGIKVPKELAIIGFDSNDFAKALTPVLEVVVQPLDEIAKNAADALLTRLNQKQQEWKNEIIQLDIKLIKGQTVI